MDFSDIKKDKVSANIILKRAKKRGPKSKSDPSKEYIKIHPDVTVETKKQIHLLMANNDLQMWQVIEAAVQLYSEKNGLNRLN